jgi:hypothetical protein
MQQWKKECWSDVYQGKKEKTIEPENIQLEVEDSQQWLSDIGERANNQTIYGMRPLRPHLEVLLLLLQGVDKYTYNSR